MTSHAVASKNAFNEALLANAAHFAEIGSRILGSILGVDCSSSSPTRSAEGISSEKDLFVSVLFTGAVFGEFVMALRQSEAKRLLGISTDSSSSMNEIEMRNQISETFAEVLNMIAGEAIMRISDQHMKLTITPPKIHFGETRFPRVNSAMTPVMCDSSEIEFHLYVDRMRLDIASSYKKALSSLLASHRELKEALQKIRSQQDIVANAEKVAALGRMAAGVAHEINTPLATISLAEGGIRELIDYDPIEKDRLTELLDMTESMVHRISKITNTLRSYANDNSGARVSTVSLHALFDGALLFCTQQNQETGIPITLHESLRDQTIECRSEDLTQALYCLLLNSMEAVSVLPEKWIRIEAMDHGEHIEIRLTDSGNGIPSRIRHKIFDPFFSTKEFGQSSGLGLSYVKGVVTSHGGTIHANPQFAHTQFIIVLPKALPKKRNLAA